MEDNIRVSAFASSGKGGERGKIKGFFGRLGRRTLDLQTLRAFSATERKTTTVLEPIPGWKMEFRLMPTGTFATGAQAPDGPRYDDEKPRVVEIKRSFWMNVDEATNALYELVDPAHDSGVESRRWFQFDVRGFYVNGLEPPVVRVSWNDANASWQKISEASGQTFRLPGEAEWEYACRAGTAPLMNYDAVDADFSRFANLADATLRNFVCHQDFKEIKVGTGNRVRPLDSANRGRRGRRILSGKTAQIRAERLGALRHARQRFRADDELGEAKSDGVRGGSWYDRPINARSEYRASLRPWQGSFNVGFRVVCETPKAAESEAAEK